MTRMDIEEAARDCAALRTRMAARKVTRAYDEALRPIGLKATQFTLLVAIKLGMPPSIQHLADRLAMERTTLVRNLRIVDKAGLVEVGPEGRRRARALRLTTSGEARLEEALPLWRAAQKRLVGRLGVSRWQDARSLLHDITEAV